ncbi:MAG: class II glutamine amidotransferase [Gammaproteobacteria bacterium]|nr:class II glutamine amidotransferase [Gammaproteobacteria bacterium]
MCELLGMSANVPTDICFSFTGLAQRGGRTGPHRDGWGIAFFEGRGCRVFHDERSSVDSEIAKLIARYPIRSTTVISHIRKANRGRVCLENTHPFVRELWGSHWVFAHNGQLKGIKQFALGHHFPVGTTDSEHAFCWILDQIRYAFPKRSRNTAKVHGLIRELLAEIAELGTFNVLMSDSRFLYAYCASRLSWITRHAPFGQATLSDAEMSVDFCAETTPRDIVTVVATQPLTVDEHWHTMRSGELKVFRHGIPVNGGGF